MNRAMWDRLDRFWRVPAAVLLLVSLFVPLALLGAASLLNFREAVAEADARAGRSVAVLTEHALRSIRLHELVIDLVEDYLEDWNWDNIGQAGNVVGMLARVGREKEDVASVHLASPDGLATISNRGVYTGIDVRHRDYFLHAKASHSLFIGAPSTGVASGSRIFTVSRRRPGRDASFQGVIVVSAYPSYFERFYNSVKEGSDDTISLVRGDGLVIVRSPSAELPGGASGADGPRYRTLLQQIQAGRDSGRFNAVSSLDGKERTILYNRVGEYPLYVVYAYAADTVWALWRGKMFWYWIACGAAMSLLLAASAMVHRRSRLAHEAYLQGVAETRKRLETEQAARKQAQEAVRAIEQSEMRYRRLFDLVPFPVWVFDAQTYRFLAVNDAAVAKYGYSREEFLQMTVMQIRSEQAMERFRATMATPRTYPCRLTNVEHQTRDGRTLIANLKLDSLTIGNRPALLVTVDDVTEILESERQLRLAAKVFESSNQAMTITDAQCRILAVNAAYVRITGYAEAEAVGSKPSLVSSGVHGEAFFADMFASLESSDHWEGEIWNRRKDGEVYPEYMSIDVLRDEEGRISHYISLASDITQRKESERQIRYLAHYDVLTGLANRALLQDRLEVAVAQARRDTRTFALLFIDLDRLKMVNDTLGHGVGDELLKEVGQRLKGALRESDTIARQGGDEFIILLAQIEGPDSAAQVAAKLLRVIEQPFHLSGRELQVSASVGIARFPQDGPDAGTLLRNADTAMYVAKREGGGAFRFYSDDMSVLISSRLQMEEGLRRALERGELFLEYQPQVHLSGRSIMGAEALVRWRREDGSRVPPNEFIPTAEESGLILPLGQWVLRQACLACAGWHRAGHAVPVAVNVSANQFRDAAFLDKVRAVLEETQLPPGLLELELTERVMVDASMDLIGKMRSLKQLGVRFAIDDFGTGYSSLAYLKQLPIHKLKIDRAFVKGLPDDASDNAISRAIINMAHGLDLKVMAEGIETEAQARTLRRLGCDSGQGFLFHRPMLDEALQQVLEASRAVPTP